MLSFLAILFPFDGGLPQETTLGFISVGLLLHDFAVELARSQVADFFQSLSPDAPFFLHDKRSQVLGLGLWFLAWSPRRIMGAPVRSWLAVSSVLSVVLVVAWWAGTRVGKASLLGYLSMDGGASAPLPGSSDFDLSDQPTAMAVSDIPGPPNPYVDSTAQSATRTSRSRRPVQYFQNLPCAVRRARLFPVLRVAVLLRRLAPGQPLLLHQPRLFCPVPGCSGSSASAHRWHIVPGRRLSAAAQHKNNGPKITENSNFSVLAKMANQGFR